MKTKFLLIAISCTTLLFTSCEDEMGKGGGTGGGELPDANMKTNAKILVHNNEFVEEINNDSIYKPTVAIKTKDYPL